MDQNPANETMSKHYVCMFLTIVAALVAAHLLITKVL